MDIADIMPSPDAVTTGIFNSLMSSTDNICKKSPKNLDILSYIDFDFCASPFDIPAFISFPFNSILYVSPGIIFIIERPKKNVSTLGTNLPLSLKSRV